MTKPLSATMAAALAFSIDHGGKLVRHAGGYWTYPGCPKPHEEYFGTTTIQALVDRGELRYVEWKGGRGGRFPIAVNIAPRSALDILKYANDRGEIGFAEGGDNRDWLLVEECHYNGWIAYSHDASIGGRGDPEGREFQKRTIYRLTDAGREALRMRHA